MRRTADGMAAISKKHPYRRALIALLALGVVAGLAVLLSPPSRAQTGVPRTLGRIDQSFVWSPRDNVVPAFDACQAKQPDVQPTWTGSSYELPDPDPVCLLRVMRAGGASSNAIAFARWYYRAEGDYCYIERLWKPQFGVVSLAEIEIPSRADNNWEYIFVNGIPAVINPEAAFTTQLPWKNNAGMLAITKAHPKAGVFPDEAFIGESARPGGGQRFTLGAPIRDDCHACSILGIVYIGFDFTPRGSPKAPAITAVHRCPSSDAYCKGGGFADPPSGRQGGVSGTLESAARRLRGEDLMSQSSARATHVGHRQT